MMKKIWMLMMLVLLLCGCAAQEQPVETEPTAAETVQTETAQATEPTEATEPEKAYAPDFMVVDAEGNEVKLSDFVGKPVLLNFWASWCGPCKSEMPELEEAYQEWQDEIQFLMVNLTDGSYETLESAQEFLAGTDYTFPVYFDTASEAANAYGVSSIPTTWFIDAEGVLVARYVGAIDGESLGTGISMIMGTYVSHVPD
ncbi:MAG: TlpA family protein disulfide reductase [Oscillospiraceae bacterium]|nr:TlpA family protein disulfide reductase [Oscillospiraceae bacterium]